MKYFRDFLAMWAGIVLTVFVVYEICVAIKAMIWNVQKAFELATDWRIVVFSMLISAVAVGIYHLSRRKRRR